MSYLGVFVYIYLDDSIIFLASIKYHINHIRIVFDICQGLSTLDTIGAEATVG